MMEHMTLGQIAEACGGTYVGAEEKKLLSIAGAQSDSRKIEKDDLFIPIKGERVDGHTFIPTVFARGALATLTEHPLPDCKDPYILVSSCLTALKEIAAYYRSRLAIVAYSNRRHYGERRQDQHQGNDRFRAFRQISCLKDRRQFQQ